MLIFLWELWISLKLVSWLLGKMLCFDHPSFADFSFFKFDGFLLPFSDCWSISMLQGLRKTDHHANILGDIIESVNGKEVTNNNDLFKILDLCKEGDKLESIDTAPEVPHPRPTRLPACRTASAFFFFFSRIRADSARFALMRLDSCRIGFNSRWTELIWPKSGRIGHIGSYRPAADTAETGRKKVKTCRKYAGNCRNRPWIWSENPKLAFFFLFLWIKA